MEKRLEEMSLGELWEMFPIQLRPYNPCYPRWYEAQRAELAALVPEIRRISHIGSTAVPGLLSKPIVDILLETEAPVSRLAGDLAVAGWRLMSEQEGDDPRLVCNRGYTPRGFARQVFHLHVRRPGDWGELYFRDYLLEHPDTVSAYADLKRRLLPRYEHDRDGYTEAKTGFIAHYTACARRLYPGRYRP